MIKENTPTQCSFDDIFLCSIAHGALDHINEGHFQLTHHKCPDNVSIRSYNNQFHRLNKGKHCHCVLMVDNRRQDMIRVILHN